jgi:hypothetical protein
VAFSNPHGLPDARKAAATVAAAFLSIIALRIAQQPGIEKQQHNTVLRHDDVV